MNGNDKSKTFLIFSITGAFLLCVFYLLAVKSIFSLNGNVSQKSAQISQKADNKEQNRLRRLTVQNTEKERAKIDSYFIGKDNVVDFLDSVEALGKKSGVSAKIFNVGLENISGEASSTAEKLKISIEAVGKWQKIYNFLNYLSLISYSISFEDIELSKMDAGQTADGKKILSENWQAHISASVLKLK